MVIVAKLEEALQSHFYGSFQIVEYTSREGIDSITRCRKSDLDPIGDYLTEFEFELRNFFRHRHPIRQVDFIICWSLGGITDGIYKFGSGDIGGGVLTFEMKSVGWKKLLQFSDYLITVVPLNSLPELTISDA